jgi:hypothetical protein
MKKDNVMEHEVKEGSPLQLLEEHHALADAVMEKAGVDCMRDLYSSPGLVQKYKDELASIERLEERFDSALKEVPGKNWGEVLLEENFSFKGRADS